MALNDNAGLGQRARSHEKPTARVDIEKYDSSRDDFEKWVDLFESAVGLATGTTGDALGKLCIRWLRHKLDEEARGLLDQAEKTEWPELKEELKELLVDPQERYKWQARKIKVKWDGKESLHQLATRVTRLVDKYEKKETQEHRKMQYFLRFVEAFKGPMRKFIFMGCPEGSRTIEVAKDVAMRYQLSMIDEEDGEDTEVFKAGAFGSLQPDRATGIETALAGISTQLENMAVSARKVEEKHEQRFSSLEQRMGQMEASGRQAGQPWSQWSQQGNSGWQTGWGPARGRGAPRGFGRGGPPARGPGFGGNQSFRGGNQGRGYGSGQRPPFGQRGRGGSRGNSRGGGQRGGRQAYQNLAIESGSGQQEEEAEEEEHEYDYGEEEEEEEEDWSYCSSCEGWGVN